MSGGVIAPRKLGVSCWVTVHPEGLVQLRNTLVADAEGLNAPEGNTTTSEEARMCRSVGVLRPRHAGRDTSKNLGSPLSSCPGAGRWRSTVKGKAHRKRRGCLIKRSTLSVGKPRTWG